MILAISVGVSALGGIGATGEPGEGVGDNAAAELGTLIVGVVTFGMAAFMPFLLFKLMPVVAAAVVAQGVASGPMRAGQQGMQMQYYGSSTMRRLGGSNGGSAGKSGAGAAGQSGGAGPGGPSGVAGGAGPAGGSAGAASQAVVAVRRRVPDLPGERRRPLLRHPLLARWRRSWSPRRLPRLGPTP